MRGNTALAHAYELEEEAEPELIDNIIPLGQRRSLQRLFLQGRRDGVARQREPFRPLPLVQHVALAELVHQPGAAPVQLAQHALQALNYWIVSFGG